jgi:hypothetical protein
MATKKSDRLAELRKAIKLAEASVSEVSDEALKVAGFQTVLAHILTQGGDMPTGESHIRKTKEMTHSKSASTAKQGPKGRVEELIQEGFFVERKTIADLRAELASRGYHHKLSELSPILLQLCKEKHLRRVKEPTANSSKLVWQYSNW